MRRNENLVHCWEECKLVQSLGKTAEVAQKFKNRTNTKFSSCTSWYFSKKNPKILIKIKKAALCSLEHYL